METVQKVLELPISQTKQSDSDSDESMHTCFTHISESTEQRLLDFVQHGSKRKGKGRGRPRARTLPVSEMHKSSLGRQSSAQCSPLTSEANCRLEKQSPIIPKDHGHTHTKHPSVGMPPLSKKVSSLLKKLRVKEDAEKKDQLQPTQLVEKKPVSVVESTDLSVEETQSLLARFGIHNPSATQKTTTSYVMDPTSIFLDEADRVLAKIGEDGKVPTSSSPLTIKERLVAATVALPKDVRMSLREKCPTSQQNFETSRPPGFVMPDITKPPPSFTKRHVISKPPRSLKTSGNRKLHSHSANGKPNWSLPPPCKDQSSAKQPATVTSLSKKLNLPDVSTPPPSLTPSCSTPIKPYIPTPPVPTPPRSLKPEMYHTTYIPPEYKTRKLTPPEHFSLEGVRKPDFVWTGGPADYYAELYGDENVCTTPDPDCYMEFYTDGPTESNDDDANFISRDKNESGIPPPAEFCDFSTECSLPLPEFEDGQFDDIEIDEEEEEPWHDLVGWS